MHVLSLPVRVIPTGTVPHLIGLLCGEDNRKSWLSGWPFYLVFEDPGFKCRPGHLQS